MDPSWSHGLDFFGEDTQREVCSVFFLLIGHLTGIQARLRFACLMDGKMTSQMVV